MLPIVSVQRKRSSSKFSGDFNISPGTDKILRSEKNKSLTALKRSSPLCPKHYLKEINSSVGKPKETKKLLMNQVFEPLPSLPQKAEDFEEILNDRLEKYTQGNSEYISEIDVIDSVFYDVISHLKNYENIFRILRQKLDACIFEQAKEEFGKKVDKLKKEKDVLILKINSLSDINSKLQEENKKLLESRENFKRLFSDNPDLLIKYQNIVDQMLQQCKVITEQKKELKKLRKYQELYKELAKEFEQKLLIVERLDILDNQY
ncbi:hypothetical protein SteCoe_3707 [Stentor coeruleus]|uniref:Uncharacterized protein n=1 Tax=Stentor coeruleus TaxID=5963 RepID=A0A1R2CWH6_9CILI|nr:hypothetical protein SteCoe_3707 [Stentor coeruleus]